MSDWTLDTRLVRAFRPPADGFDSAAWPATVPAAAQLLRGGLELPPGITILVGENGSGKSTVVEMLAEAYGLNPQGGSILAPAVRLRETEPGAGRRLGVERGAGGRAAWAYFMRADTMHSLYTYLEENPGRSLERFHELSHGQGFLEILRTRVNQRGFYLMDEPDAPLSFVASLSLVALLHDLAGGNSQVVVATHSPVVAATPGAHLLELGEWGIRPARWADLEIVRSWRDFLNDPAIYLHYLLDDEELHANDHGRLLRHAAGSRRPAAVPGRGPGGAAVAAQRARHGRLGRRLRRRHGAAHRRQRNRR
jgi:predicted ATPase